ncbi:MAG: porin [Nitratireductor sp.]|jgi:hypothetical protein|nr:porin [Nitratireductor sp.]
MACLIALSGPAAFAQERPVADFDYDALVEELPIESEVYGPSNTIVDPSGGVFVFYGQFNLAYQSFDDGEQVTDGLVDNGNWNSRLGFTFTQPLDFSTFRIRFESALGLRSSAAVSQEFLPDWINWQRTSLRWFEVASDSDFGTISLGQGSTASDGTAGLDDSFTFVAGATDSSDGFGAFRFRDGNGKLTAVTIGAVNSSFNGTRRFRARYDTPVVGGLMLSTSYGENILVEEDDADYYDIAARWTGNIGDFAVRAAAGYQWIDNPDLEKIERLAGSATIVHTPTGLNFSVSAGEQIDGASYVWARAGWRNDFFEFGTTSLSVDYYRGWDFLSDGARTENYGVYAVQSIDAASIDLYAGWRVFTYSDQLGGTYQDAQGILTGARFFF